MKFFTGDESGLVKWIVFPPKVEEKKLRKRAKKVDDSSEKKEKEKAAAPEFFSGTFSTINKEEAVQQMSWAMLDGSKELLIGRKSGKIQYMSPETGEIVREYKDSHVGTAEGQGSFVGLYGSETHLASCSSTGQFSYTLLSSSSSASSTTAITSLGAGINVMRGHSTQSHIFAAGGKDRDLCVYDASVLASQNDSTEKVVSDPKGPNKNTSKHKAAKNASNGIVFQAKNVKNDFLDLQQPVWIRDLQFMSEDTSKVVVGTHHHQIRLYDAKAARRPVLNVEIGKNPITNVRVGKDYNHVMFTDTMSNAGTIDIRTGAVVARYKGFTGAVTDLVVAPQPTFTTASENAMLVSVSLDRFLRVHEMSSMFRRCVNKAYLKQRMSCVLVDEEYELPESEIKKVVDEEEEEENAMWDSLAKVDSVTKRKRASN